MGAMVSKIPGVSIVCSIVCSDADHRKHQSSAPQAFVRGISLVTDWFPSQRASDVVNVSIWWRHHDLFRNCIYARPVLWKHNERDLYTPVYIPENRLNVKYFQVISYSKMVSTLIFFLLAIFPWSTETSTSWEQPQSTVSVRNGHYPYNLCHVTSAILNSTDGKFYVFGDSSLAEKCQKISAIWDFEANEVRQSWCITTGVPCWIG